MAQDIQNAVLDRLVELFTEEMQTKVDPTDPLYLVTIDRSPLQDDPTTAAPFVIVGIGQEPSRILDPLHSEEVGGGLRWMNFFVIAGRIAQCDDKATAYQRIGILHQRALRVLIQHYDLDGLASDDGETIFGSTYEIVDDTNLRVFGGETEWFGEFLIKAHFFSEETWEMKVP